MKIVYHPEFLNDYPTVSVECPDRIEAIRSHLEGTYDFVEPPLATDDDLLLCHTPSTLSHVGRDDLLDRTARLAAGAAIVAARLAAEGEPSFGLLRPPGHHASPDSRWGFCFYNNMAVALLRLLTDGLIGSALVLDIDLHFGDGTANILDQRPEFQVVNTHSVRPDDFLKEVREELAMAGPSDIIGVSAGFDTGEWDWGGILSTEDFGRIGEMVRDFSGEKCNGRRFAILEGGYYLPDLGKNVRAFVDGMA
ncbi:MAG: histone deacetylase family protein [Proteobacteria bacterium]|nr:histone deacetylase family protein [Pseudomonadota bacterium]